MNLRSRCLIAACAVILSAGSPAPVHAQGQASGDKRKALELYEKGKVQYDLGRWRQAVDLWTQAYETYNASEFLFNIGQAYRHEGNCEQAMFFYRRYLATKPNARNRTEVEGFIADMEAKCKGARPRPATGEKTREGGGGRTGTARGSGRSVDSTTGSGAAAAAGTGGSRDGGQRPDEGPDGADASGAEDRADEGTEGEAYEQSIGASVERPRLLAVRVAVGPSFPSMGNLDIGTLLSLALGIGHPLYVRGFILEPGALVTYTPVPWEVVETGAQDTAGLTGLLANFGASYAAMPKLSIRAEAGVGIMVFSGLTVDGNPFLAEDESATGPISMFEVRASLGLEYAISKNFVVHAQPAVLTYSPTPPLRDDISSITRFEMLFGAGYAM